MTLLVTSAAGANGAGYGKILAFADDGKPIGVFGGDPRIVDPRGLGSSRVDGLLFVNSGSDRILALDRNGHVVHASRSIVGLNPGGGNSGLTADTMLASAASERSWPSPESSTG